MGVYTGIWSEWSKTGELSYDSHDVHLFTRKCLPSQITKIFHSKKYLCSDLLGQGEKKEEYFKRKHPCYWSQWSEWSCSEPCIKNVTSFSIRYYEKTNYKKMWIVDRDWSHNLR